MEKTSATPGEATQGMQQSPSQAPSQAQLQQPPPHRPGRPRDYKAASCSRTIVADEPGRYRIIHYRQKVAATKVFVTFNPVASGLDDKPFGFPFLTDQGFDHVHVAQAPGSYYQELSLDDFARHVAPLVAGQACFTYGSSLGGYCALHYGGILDARIVAASPRNSAHPVTRKKLPNGPVFRHGELSAGPRSSKAPFVFLDRHIGADAEFYDHCIRPAYPDAQPIVLPHAGHGAFMVLMEANVLKKLVVDIANDAFLPDRFEVDLSETSIYLRSRAMYLLSQRRFGEAIEAARLSIDKKVSLQAYNVLIRAGTRSRDWQFAAQVHEEALARLPAKDHRKLADPAPPQDHDGPPAGAQQAGLQTLPASRTDAVQQGGSPGLA